MDFLKLSFSDLALPEILGHPASPSCHIQEQEGKHGDGGGSGGGAPSWSSLVNSMAAKSEEVLEVFRGDLNTAMEATQGSLEALGQAVEDLGETVWRIFSCNPVTNPNRNPIGNPNPSPNPKPNPNRLSNMARESLLKRVMDAQNEEEDFRWESDDDEQSESAAESSSSNEDSCQGATVGIVDLKKQEIGAEIEQTVVPEEDDSGWEVTDCIDDHRKPFSGQKIEINTVHNHNGDDDYDEELAWDLDDDQEELKS